MGFSYLSPHGTVTRTDTTPNLIGSYDAISLGVIFSISYLYKRRIGLQAETSIHEWGVQNSNPPGQTGPQAFGRAGAQGPVNTTSGR
jgi:hypothetical protein